MFDVSPTVAKLAALVVALGAFVCAAYVPEGEIKLGLITLGAATLKIGLAGLGAAAVGKEFLSRTGDRPGQAHPDDLR